MNELSTIDCPHFGACSGCALAKKVNEPPIWTEVKKYFPVDLVTGSIIKWRTKAKLAIRGKSEAPEIGLYRAGSHDVQTISFCQAHHPAINQAVKRLKDGIVAEKISIYNERTGLLRYAQFFVELATGKVQLVLVVTQEHSSLERLMKRLETQDGWHSLWFNVQPARTNQIFGPSWILSSGEKYLEQTLNGMSVLFHPASFAQAHWTLFEKLAAHVVAEVPEQAKLLELYAGSGAIGRLAAHKCSSVHVAENNPFSHQSFLATENSKDVIYHLEDVKESCALVPSADCIIVDPPRKGLDPALLSALESHKGKLIYVSCDFASFVKDADRLQASGWTLQSGKGYLLFPGTNHVEIVATLTSV